MVLWLGTSIIFCIFYLVLSIRRGPAYGLAIVVPISWLVPAWVQLNLFDSSKTVVATGLDIKSTVGIACLIMYCLVPGRKFPVRLVLADLAMLGLVCTHLLSDLTNDGGSWLPLGRAYVEWFVPYVVGRLAFQSLKTAEQVAVVPVLCALLMASMAIFESLSGVNPFELAFGQRPLEGSNQMQRWGLYRAFGPTLNPIYFAVVQLLLSGWVMFLLSMTLTRRARPIWLLAPIITLAGIIGCATRAVLVSYVIGLIAIPFFLKPRIRWTMFGGAVAGLILIVVLREPVFHALELWGSEDREHQTIMIEGKTQRYSNARARMLLFDVYRVALKRSGLLGFGTAAVTGFPINVPIGAIDLATLHLNRSVENSYALMMLRFGWLGASCFLGAAILSVYQLVKLADAYPGSSLQYFCAAIGSFLLAVLFAQATVWMPHEIGFPLVWTFGVSSGLTLAHREQHRQVNLSRKLD